MLRALMPISSFPYVAACLLIARAAIRGSGSITRPERCRRSNSQGHRTLASYALLPASSRGRRSGLAQDARLLLRCALSAPDARFPHRFGSPEARSAGIVHLSRVPAGRSGAAWGRWRIVGGSARGDEGRDGAPATL